MRSFVELLTRVCDWLVATSGLPEYSVTLIMVFIMFFGGLLIVRGARKYK